METLLSAFFGLAVGSLVSIYVARLQFVSTVVSQYRREWIDRLLDTIAEYQSVIFRINSYRSQVDQSMTPKDARDYLEKGSRLGNKILLMLDPGDSAQKKLRALVLDISVELAKRDGYNPQRVGDLQDEIIDAARAVFESEWLKAKKGK